MSFRKLREFSLPWPSWSPSYVYQAPDFDEALLDADVDESALAAEALAPEDVELGLLERAATLFLTTLIRVRLPTAVGALA